jgi:hypothetical protein
VEAVAGIYVDKTRKQDRIIAEDLRGNLERRTGESCQMREDDR